MSIRHLILILFVMFLLGSAYPTAKLGLNAYMPPILFLQALDDPWVPAKSAEILQKSISIKGPNNLEVLLTSNGGHNGFHGINGCWGDQVVELWLKSIGF